MNKQIVIIGITLIFLAVGLSGCNGPSAKEMYNEAQDFQHHGYYSSAIGTYEELIYNYPNDEYASIARAEIPKCYYTWGKQLQNQSEYENALVKYTIILQSYSGAIYESKAVDRIIEIGQIWNITTPAPSPERAYMGGNYSIIEMENDANQPISIVFSGPTYTHIRLRKGEIKTVDINNPGVYYIVGTATGVILFTGTEDLTMGYKYSWVWYIKTTYSP